MATATRLLERPILFSDEMVRAILDGRKTQTRRVMKPQPPEGITELIGPEWYTPKVVNRHGQLVEGPMVYGVYDPEGEWGQRCPYWPGMRLWVREAFTYWERRESDETLRPGESRDYKKPTGFARFCERLLHEGEDYLKYLADGHLRSFGEWSYPHPIYEHCVGRFNKTLPSIHMPRWASRITLEVLEVRVQRVQEISEEDATAEGCPAIVAPPRVVCGETIDMNVSAIERYRDLWNSLNLRRGFGWDANPWVRAVTFQRVTTEHAEVSDEANQDRS